MILLFGSQALADGDEAIIGIMAMDILAGKGFPLYPYGVSYGLGGGVEAYLAAISFAFFGVSAPALKVVGLLFWLGSLVLVALVSYQYYGRKAAAFAALLFMFCPPAGILSSKVEGGHLVAIACFLCLMALRNAGRDQWLFALAAPTLFIHPLVVIPTLFLVVLTLTESRHARRGVVTFFVTLCVSSLLLWPDLPDDARGWNPVSEEILLRERMARFGIIAANLFSHNVNAGAYPELPVLFASLTWLGVFLFSLAGVRERSLLITLIAATGLLLAVDPLHLAARHCLLLLPLAAIIMGGRLAGPGLAGVLVLALLLSTGAFVQWQQTRSPYIYGAGPQAAGVQRQMVEQVIAVLDRAGVRHLYVTEPMLHWVFIFATKGEVAARWLDPHDRIPEYARRVDAARDSGLPVSLLYRDQAGKYNFILKPNHEWLRQRFPPVRRTTTNIPDKRNLHIKEENGR